ncbi:diguanylate cyclase [Campylobacter sp. JMF_01 NE2]|uniref:sensor domain-containing diguanylate cyclase n=1 Tax=unclassified Campylobacter TaxID=2593542 RepID=UPI0022E9B544|nr:MULTISPECIES: diguanylate cyclase [unclassified Campylobacter]MDA3052124.1 diguanylate cyclase [Campylobacter sp. JMF_03 NE3]MDA3066458.1 diguanylate cyclase [Campylobacter sp. JMF_01 NE2]
MEDKRVITKRFFIALILGILAIFALVFCIFGFVGSNIQAELSTKLSVAKNAVKDRNAELFSELEILSENLKTYQGLKTENEYARRTLYFRLIEHTASQKQNFDAIFYVRAVGNKDEVIASYFNDSAMANLGELRLDNFISKIKDNRYISRFMQINGANRYFLIQKVEVNTFLIAFANTTSLNDKFAGLGEILIFNKEGEIFNITNDIFALYTNRFDFEGEKKLKILKSLGERKFVYFEKFDDSNNFIMISKNLKEYLSPKNLLVLLALGFLFLYLLITLINYKFLKRRIFDPLHLLHSSVSGGVYKSTATKIETMGALDQILEIAQKLDESVQYSGRASKVDFTFFDALKKSSLMIFSVENTNGMINNASLRAKELYGDDIVGKNIFTLEATSLYENARQSQISLYTKENYVIHTHDTPNGKKDMYIKKTFVRNGEDILVLYVLLDASKYRKFYTDTKEKYKYLNDAPIVTVVIKGGEIIDVSASSREIWGYENTQILEGKTYFWSLFQKSDADSLQNELRNLMSDTRQNNEVTKRVYPILHRNSIRAFYEITICLYKKERKVVMYFTNIHDKLMEINKLKSDMKSNEELLKTRSYSPCTIDLLAKKIMLSKEYMEILGSKEASVDTEMSIGDFVAKIYYVDLKKFNDELNKCKLGISDEISCEIRIKLNDELSDNDELKYAWISLQGYASKKEKRSGGAEEIVATIEDITAKKDIEAELNLNSNVFLRSLEAIVITDDIGRIIRANRAFYTIMQFSETDVVGEVPEYFRVDHDGGIMGEIKEKLDKESLSYTDEIYCVKKNGDDFPALFSAIAIKDEFGVVSNYILMFNEISEIKKKESELVKIAHHDALTGLPNRIYIMNAAGEYLSAAKEQNRLAAVLFIDFDGFKAINDNFGHDVGDLFLQEVSKTMNNLLRKGDILARLGGDEFGAIIGDLKDEKAAHALLERLLGIANKKFNLDGNEVSASVSVGAAFYDGSEEIDFNELLSRADRAMYRAKTSGKNRYCIFDKENFDDLQISEERLKKSIENNEFFMLYQPIIDDKDKIYGYELLLRWRRENLGVLLPSDFLFDIREPKLEILISKFSFTQMLKFNKETNSLCSINISLEVLKSDEFYHFASRAIEKYAPKTELFMFEITDFNDRTAADFKLIRQRYADFGIKFALNNANHQNSKYLKGMPFDIIKIDMRLCLDVAKKREGIKNLLDLVKYLRGELKFEKLGAQGIENALSRRLLKNFKFNFMQGNFLGKAVDRREITAIIAKLKEAKGAKPITKDEFENFLIALDYKNIALEFLENAEHGDITDLRFEVFQEEIKEIKTRIEKSTSHKFMLNTEINKQILDILALEFEDLQSFITKYKARVDKFILNLEES